jgi:hypothetical protein
VGPEAQALRCSAALPFVHFVGLSSLRRTAASPNLATADTSAARCLQAALAPLRSRVSRLLASPRSPAPLPAASSGGAGSSENGLAQNLDQSPLGGKILQSEAAEQGCMGQLRWLVAHLTVLALPPLAGRWRGIRKAVKRIRAGLFSNRLESGWVVSGEGVVGATAGTGGLWRCSVDGQMGQGGGGR